EALEARVAERLPVLRHVGAEAARAAGAGRQEDVLADDPVPREPVLLERLQVLHEVPDGEVGRVALAAVPELLPEAERLVVRDGQRPHVVPDAAERRREEEVLAPREPRDPERRLLALGLRERGRRGLE